MPATPPTAEGWFVLHDFRRVDWDAWRDADDRRRQRALEEGVAFLRECEAVADAETGDAAVFSVVGDDADLLFLYLRPAAEDLDGVERRFEQTAFAAFTERVDAYVSVTEVSGYVSREYFEGGDVDEGTRRYIESKLRPEIPDADYASFYPMAKRRDPDANWYDLSFEERADLMAEHGELGREFAGRVHQLISSSAGLDDWEWGVTLFGDDPTDLKDIVYRMRFDEASSRYGEFGEFVLGRRFPPEGLGALLDGEELPRVGDATGAEAAAPHGGGHGDGAADASPHGSDDAADSAPHGGADAADAPHDGDGGDAPVRAVLDDHDVYAGQPRGEDVHALALYSTADPEELADDVAGLRANFDHYDTHEGTSVYVDSGGGPAAVVSLWARRSAAETAAGFLADLPGVVGTPAAAGDHAATAVVEGGSDEPASADSAGGEGTGADGWGTMGMFYTVKPEHREDFTETFAAVQDELAEMDGHRQTRLLANREDENDMFIASEWRSREDALAFFRSDAFAETVEWGREVLDGRPRHVFLA